MPTWAAASTSAAEPLPPIMTGSKSTAAPLATGHSSAATPISLHRSRWAKAPISPPAAPLPMRYRRMRWQWPGPGRRIWRAGRPAAERCMDRSSKFRRAEQSNNKSNISFTHNIGKRAFAGPVPLRDYRQWYPNTKAASEGPAAGKIGRPAYFDKTFRPVGRRKRRRGTRLV